MKLPQKPQCSSSFPGSSCFLKNGWRRLEVDVLFSMSVEEGLWVAGVIVEVQRSLRSNQTPPPEHHLTFPINAGFQFSLFTWDLSDVELLTRLSSTLCWHRQAAPSLTRLINSCSATLTATVVHPRVLTYTHTSSEGFPLWDTWPFVTLHILICFDFFYICLNSLSISTTPWSDVSVLDTISDFFFPCIWVVGRSVDTSVFTLMNN